MNYDREFKLLAVELGKNQEDIGNLAQELGIKQYLIYRWRREFSNSESNNFPGHGNRALIPQEEELARLKKQPRDEVLERDI